MATSIAEVAIAMKLAELAKRCGLKASHVDGHISFYDSETGPYEWGDTLLCFVSGSCDPSEKTEKFFNLLEMKNTRTRVFHNLEDLEDLVDHALLHAPRSRSL